MWRALFVGLWNSGGKMADTSKWAFQTNDRVEVDLGGPYGIVPGTILGIAVENVVQMFIVGLDNPVGPFKAVVMPASAITKRKPKLNTPEKHGRLIPTKRSCNIHDDCDAADARAKRQRREFASHCHDEECEDCFGK